MGMIWQGLVGKTSYLVFESPQLLLLQSSLCPSGRSLLIVLPQLGSGVAVATGPP